MIRLPNPAAYALDKNVHFGEGGYNDRVRVGGQGGQGGLEHEHEHEYVDSDDEDEYCQGLQKLNVTFARALAH